jgi:hypothetical protein
MSLMSEVLPLGHDVYVASVRRQVQRVTERGEDALGEERAMFIESTVNQEGIGTLQPARSATTHPCIIFSPTAGAVII